jgi:hypothetical protein
LYFYHFQISLFCTLNCVKITKNLQESTYFFNNIVYSSKLNLEAEISLENVIPPMREGEEYSSQRSKKTHRKVFVEILHDSMVGIVY